MPSYQLGFLCQAFIPQSARDYALSAACPSDAAFASALVSEKLSSVYDFSGCPLKSEILTDESDDEDSQSTISAADMPPLGQPHPGVAYSFENLTDMDNFNGSSTQCMAQFEFKPSPNGRRVSEDSNADDDTKPSSVVQNSFGVVLNLGQTQHASVSPRFDFVSYQPVTVPSGFGETNSYAPAKASYNADSFVDSLLNGDFSGDDFSRDPIVTEDDEVFEI